MTPTLADPEFRDTPGYQENDEYLPKILSKMNEEQKASLYHLVQKKAWILATQIEDFTDQELEQIATIKKQKGLKASRKAANILYNRHHWRALKWFLFGGLVDIPIQQNPKKAWDPVTNPFIKIRVRSFVYTQDEHDNSNPIKRLPDKDYLRLLAYAWIHEPKIVIPKSRQMMVTWLFSSIAVHETLFREAKTTAWISKKFDDANANIDKRIQFVSNHLPRQQLNVPEHKYVKGIFECGATGSIIRAMGEEAKGLRQYTFSWVFDDEAAFQEQAEGIVQAALPTVNGGGRFTLVSSANGKEVFYNLVTESGKIAAPPGR